MTQARYLQVHALTQYTAAMLNRDDSGLAKRLPYGGVTRTRISSQCLKRHWRKDEGPFSLMNIAPDPYRTKELAEKAVMKRVTEMLPGEDMTQEVHIAVAQALNVGLYGRDGNDRNKRQPLLFGQSETEYLAKRVAEILRENPDTEKAAEAVGAIFDEKSERQNFSAFRQSIMMPAGIIGAMFGRMVTSDVDANIDSAVSVAHAFTIHREESEVDYFTAMGDLAGAEPGAEHIGATEINRGAKAGGLQTSVAFHRGIHPHPDGDNLVEDYQVRRQTDNLDGKLARKHLLTLGVALQGEAGPDGHGEDKRKQQAPAEGLTRLPPRVVTNRAEGLPGSRVLKLLHCSLPRERGCRRRIDGCSLRSANGPPGSRKSL